MTNRAESIQTLRDTQAALTRLVAPLPAEALDFRPGPDDWSIREILAHLVDDEMYVTRTRLERIVKEDNPHLAPHDEKQWHADRNTTRDERDQLLGDFALQRSASMGMIDMLRDSDWARVGFQPEYGSFSAEGWLGHWAAHDLTHLRQIEANVAAFETARSA